jgi:hypothetical protein
MDAIDPQIPPVKEIDIKRFEACIYENMTTLAEFVEQLPPDIQREVKDFAEFLLKKRAQKKHEVPVFDWEGALRDLAEQYTSVELQHEISRMRGDWVKDDGRKRHGGPLRVFSSTRPTRPHFQSSCSGLF